MSLITFPHHICVLPLKYTVILNASFLMFYVAFVVYDTHIPLNDNNISSIAGSKFRCISLHQRKHIEFTKVINGHSYWIIKKK
jgi:hypothetical protein